MQQTAPPVVSAVRLTEASDDETLAIGTLIASVWPRPDRGPVERAKQLAEQGRSYSGPGAMAPVSFVVWDGDKVVAHALTFRRTIRGETGERDVMALAMVAADAGQRGRGLGAAVVKSAFGRVDDASFEASLFQTSFGVRPFYEKLGACLVENPIIDSTNHDAAGANPFWDDVVMRYRAADAWPDGQIDLNGPGY